MVPIIPIQRISTHALNPVGSVNGISFLPDLCEVVAPGETWALRVTLFILVRASGAILLKDQLTGAQLLIFEACMETA